MSNFGNSFLNKFFDIINTENPDLAAAVIKKIEEEEPETADNYLQRLINEECF